MKPSSNTSHNTSHSIDLIIHAGWVIPMATPDPQVLTNHSVVINKGTILGIYPTQALPTDYQAQLVLDKPDHVLLPGFINSHGHSPMSLFRGFADDLPLMTWLQAHIWPAEQQWVSSEFVEVGSRLAIAEMLLSGTTSFTDMYFFPETTAKVALQAGIRAQLAAPVIEFPTPWAKDGEEHIHKSLQLHDDFKHQDRLQIGFGPHAPYTVSDKSYQRIGMLAEELDTFIQTHLHETAQEVHDSVQQHGHRPIQRLAHLGLLSPRLQAVHMTQLNSADIQATATHNVSVVHCPESNLKLASGLPPIGQLIAAGVNCTLGTDGAASNNNLDILGELQTAAQLAKAVAEDSTVLTAYQALQMVTINAAKALNREQDLGSLSKGKQADMILVDLHHANTLPVYHPISQVVYAVQAQQVTDVWVAGQPLLQNRQFMTLDRQQVYAQAIEWGNKIRASS